MLAFPALQGPTPSYLTEPFLLAFQLLQTTCFTSLVAGMCISPDDAPLSPYIKIWINWTLSLEWTDSIHSILPLEKLKIKISLPR